MQSLRSSSPSGSTDALGAMIQGDCAERAAGIRAEPDLIFDEHYEKVLSSRIQQDHNIMIKTRGMSCRRQRVESRQQGKSERKYILELSLETALQLPGNSAYAKHRTSCIRKALALLDSE